MSEQISKLATAVLILAVQILVAVFVLAPLILGATS